MRSIKDRLRARFNVSVAEVDAHEYWQSAVLGLSAVGTDRAFVEGLLNRAVSVIGANRHVEIMKCEKEFV